MVFMWRRYMPTRTGLRTPSPAPTTGHRRETKPVAMRGACFREDAQETNNVRRGGLSAKRILCFQAQKFEPVAQHHEIVFAQGLGRCPPTGVQAPPNPETISCRMKDFRECICDCGQTVPMTAIRDFHALIASFWPRARVFSTGEPQMRRSAGGFYSAGGSSGWRPERCPVTAE